MVTRIFSEKKPLEKRKRIQMTTTMKHHPDARRRMT
jgi:hypothetical protein